MKPTPGSQLALFAAYSYHGCITDRDGDTLELEADHRRQAEIENAIRDPASSAGQALKYSVGLNHLPSGRFPANAAWLAVQSLPRTRYGVLAHNLARWAGQRASVWASRWRIASNRMLPKIRDAILCLNGMGGSALTANSAGCRDLICIHSGSPNSRYVMRANSSALTLRLVWQSSLATLPI